MWIFVIFFVIYTIVKTLYPMYNEIKVMGRRYFMMQNVCLEMNGIHKRFHGVHALKGVHLDLRAGEIHALVG